MTIRIRDASAVVLTRAEGREVFLVERAPELRFFGGYWACPGGVVDPVDRDDDAGVGRPSEREHARCAVRELFEETGVALPGSAASELGPDARRALRLALARGDDEAWSAVGSGGDDRVRRIFELTTPPFAPVLYRTSFVHLELPPGETPEVLPGELTRGRFFRPDEVLERWLAGEMFVVPPVVFLLGELARRPVDEAFAELGRIASEIERGRLHEVRHTPGVFTAPLETPTLPPATTTNCYLVGDERVYVVDPATWSERERARLFAVMDEWIDAGRRFEGVLVTHHHRDHVGSVGATSRRYGLPVLGHAETLARLPEAPERARPLADGDALELGAAPDGRADWRLWAYHTPGHDRGHLVFLEDRYRALIAGDLVSTLSTIVIDPPEGHMRTYLDSLERVRGLGVGVLYPAHGPAAKDGTALVERYLVHRRAREAKLVVALEDGAVEEGALLARVYDDTPPALSPVAARSLRAGLEKLEEDGRARRCGARWEFVG
jgi:glyoxylase-like metal-dependent hydrolase (beta-lactamase superfamily II)/8-oxo-dGTP pyrophosphatase MutT (NUDIX family)